MTTIWKESEPRNTPGKLTLLSLTVTQFKHITALKSILYLNQVATALGTAHIESFKAHYYA